MSQAATATRHRDRRSERKAAGRWSRLGSDVRRRCPASKGRAPARWFDSDSSLATTFAAQDLRLTAANQGPPATHRSAASQRRPAKGSNDDSSLPLCIARTAAIHLTRLKRAASPIARHATIRGRVGRVSARGAQRFGLRRRPVETPLRYSSTACFSRRRNARKSGLRSSMKAFSPSTASADPRAWASSSMPCCQEA